MCDCVVVVCNMFFEFSPPKTWEMIHFDLRMFQIGALRPGQRHLQVCHRFLPAHQ